MKLPNQHSGDRANRPPSARLTLAVAAAWACAGAGTAQAAEAPVLPLQTLTIIGEAAPRPAFDVPAAVDVVDGARLRDQQPQVNLSEALSRVPGLLIQNRQNYAQDLQVSSRGFGARATFGVRGVRLIQDGVPLTMPDGQGQAALFDLEGVDRVEVLRGPFAALFGNAAGGVIHLSTADGPARPFTSVSAWAGADDSARLAWRLGGRAGDWSYAANVSRFSTEGFRAHSAATRDVAHLRLRGQLTPATQLTLVGSALEQPDTEDPLGLTRAQLETDRRQPGNNALAYDTHKDIRHRQLGASLRHRLDGGGELLVSAYGGSRVMTQFLSIPVAFQGPTSSGGVVGLDRSFAGVATQWRQQGWFAGRPLQGSVGVASDWMREQRTGHVNDLGSQGALRRDELNRVRSDDLFLMGDADLTDTLRLSAGLRHSQVRFETEDHLITADNPDDSGRVRHARAVPVAGLRWTPQRWLQLHASAGAGFETPTAAELAYRNDGGAGLNLGLAPARSRNLEAGLKARTDQGALLTATLFRADTHDDIVSAGASGGRTVFANAGRTRRDGLEFAVDAPLAGDWTAYLALTWTRARYEALTTAAGDDLAGRRLPGVPAQVAHAELAWAPPGGAWSSTLEWHAASRIAVNDANDEHAPGYGVLHWRGGWTTRFDGGQAELFVRVDNLLDQAYVGSVIVNESNRRFYEPAPGRSPSIGGRMTFRF